MGQEMDHIKHLLASVESINKRYAEVRKVYEESGVRYNIFNVLGLASSEVRLHSSILASLFDSKDHGAGDAFLRAFLRLPSLNLPEGFMTAGPVRVEVEKYLGRKTKTSGGRIDLFLTDGKDSLVIENKIYAGDQEHQLLRYHNEVPTAKLVYLTLDGKKPSQESLGGLDPEIVTCLSYEYDITEWLKDCVRIAANLPYVRETINQYIKTIQQLTSTDMPTNSELIELISKEENLSAAFAVKESMNECMNSIMNAFVAKLKVKLKEIGSPFTCVTEPKNWFTSWAKMDFANRKWNNVVFATEFEVTGFGQLIVGLNKKSHVKNIHELEGAIELSKRLGYPDRRNNDSWFYGNPPNGIASNWNNADVMKSLQNGTMISLFVEMLDQVDKCSEGLDL